MSTDRYPWASNTTPNTADQDDPRYETPGGAQIKADNAQEAAEEFTSNFVNQTSNYGDGTITLQKLAAAVLNAINHTYSGVVDASNVKDALDVLMNRVQYFIDNSGTSVAELIDARLPATGPPFENVRKRLNASDAILSDVVTSRSYQRIVKKMLDGESVIIVCYGDSITYGYIPGSGTQTANPYPAILQTLLRAYFKNNNITVYNEGYSGRQSDELASDEYIAYVTQHNPDMVIVMVGLNDKIGNFGSITAINAYMDNLSTIREKLKAYELLFMNPTPSYSGNNAAAVGNELQKLSTGLYVNAMRQFAERNTVDLLDLNKVIDNYFLYKVTNRHVGSPDLLHYIDDFYKHIGESVFALAFSPIDIRVASESYFDCTHGLFRVNNLYNYFEIPLNPFKYNIILKSNLSDVCTIYVFVDEPAVDAVIGLCKNAFATDDIDISVDGVARNVSCYVNTSGSEQSLVDCKYYIGRLAYGFHTITITPHTSAATKYDAYVVGIDFVKSVSRDRHMDYEIISSGFTTLKTTSTWASFMSQHTYLATLENGDNYHYRMFLSATENGGIGLGSAYIKGAKLPSLYLHFPYASGSYKAEVYVPQTYTANVQPGLDNITWTALQSTIIDTVANTGQVRNYIIDVVKTRSGGTESLNIYVNGTNVLTTDDVSILSNLDLRLINFTSNGKVIESHMQNIEVINGTTLNIFNLETYFDFIAGARKTYINGSWV